MFKKTFLTLLAVVASLWASAGERVIWEGSKTLPADWTDYLTVDASAFAGIGHFSQINVHFNNLCPNNEGWAVAILQDGEWTQLSFNCSEYFENFIQNGEKEGVFHRFPSVEDVNAILAKGLIINGCNVDITKISVIEEEEAPRFLHDMIWGENVGFELPTSKWAYFGSHMNAVRLTNPDFCIEGESCMAYTNTEAGNSWDNQMNYVFDTALAPGKYKLTFYARTADGQTGEIISRLMDDTYSGSGYASYFLTDSWTYFEKEIDVTSDNIRTVGFQIGQDVGTYYFDDIHFGPYISATPDNNILWRGNTELTQAYSIGLIQSPSVWAGDEITLTFDSFSSGSDDRMELVDLSTGLPVHGVTDFCRQDAKEMTIRIAVSQAMSEAIRTKGVALRASSNGYFGGATLSAIDRVRSAYKRDGLLAAGYRAEGLHYVNITLEDDCTCIGMQFYSPDPVMASEPTITLRATLGGETESVSLSSATVNLEPGGDYHAAFPISDKMRELINKAGGFSVSTNCPWTHFYDNPIDYSVLQDATQIWERDVKVEGRENAIGLPARAFSYIKGGDSLMLALNSSYGYNMNFLSHDMNQFYFEHLVRDDEFSYNNNAIAIIPVDDDLAWKLRNYGLSVYGWGGSIRGIYIDQPKPELGENVIFYGSSLTTWAIPHVIPTASLKPGDLLLISGAVHGENNFFSLFTEYGVNLRGTSQGSSQGSAFNGTAFARPDHVYFGVTEEMAANMGDNIHILGSNFTINMIERIPNVFDPTDVLSYCYSNQGYGATHYVTIPQDATELTLDLFSIDNTDEERFFYILDDKANNIYEVKPEDIVPVFENSAFTIRIPLTPEIIEAVNNMGYLRYYSNMNMYNLRVSARRSGIVDAGIDPDAPAEYFNLQGIRVDNPAPGNIYIRRQGGKTDKVIM